MMNEQLNNAPCGFLTFSKGGILISSNQTINRLLGYDSSQLVGKHINFILTKSTKMFMQLYFIPLITVQHQVDEIYLTLVDKNKEEIPVLINASLDKDSDKQLITCVMMPVHKRNEYENQLLMAKKEAEDTMLEKSEANAALEITLHALKENEQNLLKLNKQNQKFKKDIQYELELAKKIQETSLTKTISNDLIDIESHYHASRELSGDNYGFYQINDHQYGVILLDVMGNGIPSALISMSLHSLFQRLITKGNAVNEVMKELDTYLHSLFHSNQDPWHYCTAIYLIIDTENRTIECSNAGHPPAFLQHPTGEQATFNSTSPPVGTLEGIIFKTNKLKYTKGSRMMLYTDGVSEPLGEENLRHLLKKGMPYSLIQLKAHILQSLEMERNNEFKDDDQCFILIDLK